VATGSRPYATVNWPFSVTEQRLTARAGKLKDREEFNDDEKRLLDLLAQGLSRDFPNPRRIGCPGSPILRGIAFRKLRLSEVSRWLDHLSSCSPCFQEFTEMRKEAVTQRRLTRVWLGVAVALIFAGGGWLWMRTKDSARPPDTAVLDLRGISVTRGESAGRSASSGNPSLVQTSAHGAADRQQGRNLRSHPTE
jgi:hypothetical protein